MNAQSRRKIEMGTRALAFSRARPDTEPGYAAAAAKLEQLVARSVQGATAQREGIVAVRAATARKLALRRTMLSVHIAHLAEVGQEAAREDHELGNTFRFKPAASTMLAFQSAARSMANAAAVHREVLVKYGLAESVLAQFVELIDEFDEAMTLGMNGRAKHIAATEELQAVANGIVRTVRVMDGRNRQRFEGDEQVLRAWLGASVVFATPRPGPGGSTAPESSDAIPSAGDVRPAA